MKRARNKKVKKSPSQNREKRTRDWIKLYASRHYDFNNKTLYEQQKLQKKRRRKEQIISSFLFFSHRQNLVFNVASFQFTLRSASPRARHLIVCCLYLLLKMKYVLMVDAQSK